MSEAQSTPIPASPDSAFAPLRQTLFAVLWAATIIGSIGSFVRDVTSAWLVTDLSSSPAAVAMVQAAAALPVFLLAIPAGVLSDMLDRRKLLICVQLLLASVSVCLVILSIIDQHSVTSLIVLTFIGGVGVALMGPTWQAIVPELVDKKDFKNAVGLNSLGINIARAVGPALGGLLLASMGAAFTYGVDVLSYVVVIAALMWWKRPATQRDALSERFPGAFRAGLRYARASRELHIVLLRTFLFFAMASSVWALLPLVARQLLEGGPSFYGILLGAVGLGAIAGAVIMPRLRMYLSPDGLLLTSALVTSSVMALLCLAPPKWLAVSSLLILGAAWITALTTLNGVAQAILPNWVRGRSLAVYLTVFNGAMAAGSLAWGIVAQGIGVPLALLSGAVGLAAIGCIAHRIKLPKGELDLMPSNHWPEPLTATPVEYDRRPVLIQIEYRVALEDRSAFLKIMARLSAERRRDGAYAWGITEDSADPSLMLEWFQVESWAEHLRQHKRVSKSAADIQEEVLRFHQGEEGPVVRHFLTFNHPHEGRA
ncbi:MULTISPECIES: MFS transporter [unclassified Halomonas]|uniref:MFS transporter n=1 Tax=unclassified Halomonas TaxID=2609666 RepID=UPI001CF303B4|nr:MULTISPECIES: MFS transporter [unclassified Halomonas]MCA8865127.1 MFS transporter [Halomonas sp. SBBP1]UZH12103.1 MFS transporter [Halomonas sp. BDJS001]